MNEGVLIAVAILVGLVVLWSAWQILKRGFVGAVFLLGYALRQGFIGLAAYIALWVFLLPAMAVICVIVGFIVWGDARQEFDAPTSEQ